MVINSLIMEDGEIKTDGIDKNLKNDLGHPNI